MGDTNNNTHFRGGFEIQEIKHGKHSELCLEQNQYQTMSVLMWWWLWERTGRRAEMRTAVIRAQETSMVLWGSQEPEVQETLPSAHVGGCEVGFREVGRLGCQRLPQPTPDQPGLSILAKAEPHLGPHSLPTAHPPRRLCLRHASGQRSYRGRVHAAH